MTAGGGTLAFSVLLRGFIYDQFGLMVSATSGHRLGKKIFYVLKKCQIRATMLPKGVPNLGNRAACVPSNEGIFGHF